jgi:glycosyltransferase involved in cell wall biosynthesis
MSWALAGTSYSLRKNFLAATLFDADFYFGQNPDVATKKLDPFRHYVRFGSSEGRAPHPLFDPAHYMRSAGIDVLPRGITALQHYLQEGEARGVSPHPIIDLARLAAGYGAKAPFAGLLEKFAKDARPPDPHALFKADFYLDARPDVARSGVNPLVHYLQFGAHERSSPHPLFDAGLYLQRRPDVAKSGVNPLVHYIQFGASEGDSPHALFDPAYYMRGARISAFPPGITALQHYLEQGEPSGVSPHWFVDLHRLARAYSAKAFSGLLANFAQDRRPPKPHALFDPDFYLARYPDVAASGSNPLVHYVRHGATEGRDPCPFFDTAHYVSQLARPLPAGMTALQHYLLVGGPLGLSPSRLFDPHAFAQKQSGKDWCGVELLTKCLELHDGVPPEFALRELAWKEDAAPNAGPYTGKVSAGDKRRLLLVAHIAGKDLFGAERSFLDMVRAANAGGYAVFAVVPQDAPHYVNTLIPYCVEVAVLNYDWWRAGRPPDQAAIRAFRAYIKERKIDLVHSNTIMVRESLLAARSERVPTILHVREVIEADPDLLELIGERPATITNHLSGIADLIIANSRAAGQGYPVERLRVLHNCLELQRFRIPPRASDGTVRFGLISSNARKKGLADFVDLAIACYRKVPNARFIAVGPHTNLVKELGDKLRREGLNDAVQFPGYAEDNLAALADLDVIVNFSHFAESFGRTVLEGMAAGRPVLVYRHGALPELVEDGVSGFVVPYRRWQDAVPRVAQLCKDASLRHRLGIEGKRRAAGFGFEAYAKSLGGIYRDMLARKSKGGPAAPDERRPTRLPPPERVLRARNLLARREPRIAYFVWHFPAPSETFVLGELRYLLQAGVDVRVFCRHSPYPDFKPDFPITWENVASPEALAARLKETGRTLVHAHFAYPTVTDMVWPACEAAGVPFTFIPHAQDIFRYEADRQNRVGEVARSALCQRVLALGKFHREYLLERGVPEDKLLILHQGVDCARLPMRQPRTSDSLRRVVAIQRFVEKKGIDRLIRAAKLVDDDIEVHLHGFGPDEDALKKLAAELGAANVQFKGPVAGRDELLRVLGDADLVIAPCVRTASGDMDGIPTVLIEAMAVGVPVLVTPLASIPDLVVPDVTGFVMADSEPETVAAGIRRALSAPAEQVDAMVHAARRRVERRFNSSKQVPALLRLWRGATIDIVIVSWNNLPELREITARVFRFTRLPFHLIVCDNASEPEVREFLYALHRERDNVTIINRGLNSYVGPGTNCAIEHGESEYVIYLCGKEGFVFQEGWERAAVDYMDAHPDVGLAGTLGYSPTYLRGADYPRGISTFNKFRNPEFAANNPDRIFRHVQGGLFAVRRKMYAEIGGFSEDVPHSYTDVEYSYYVESRGWKLGEISEWLALYKLTRPPLAARFTEEVLAAHPPILADLPDLDGVVHGKLVLCNVCSGASAEFDAERRCPKCGSDPSARTLMRALAGSLFTYRRLKAIFISPPEALGTFLRAQFQGRQLAWEGILREVADPRGIDNRSGGLDLAYIGPYAEPDKLPARLADELARILAPRAAVYVAQKWEQLLLDRRFRLVDEVRYSSRALQYHWKPLYVCERLADDPIPDSVAAGMALSSEVSA